MSRKHLLLRFYVPFFYAEFQAFRLIINWFLPPPQHRSPKPMTPNCRPVVSTIFSFFQLRSQKTPATNYHATNIISRLYTRLQTDIGARNSSTSFGIVNADEGRRILFIGPRIHPPPIIPCNALIAVEVVRVTPHRVIDVAHDRWTVIAAYKWQGPGESPANICIIYL